MEVNTKTKTGYVVLTTSLEYNDEIYSQSEGYNLNDNHVYATKAEASADLLQRVNLEFAWMKLGQLWYSGDEPELVHEFALDIHGDDYDDLYDCGSSLADFISWCDENDRDYTDALHLYHIAEVTID